MRISHKSFVNATEKNIILNVPTQRQANASATKIVNTYYPGYNITTNPRHPVYLGEMSVVTGTERDIVFLVTRSRDGAYNANMDYNNNEQNRFNNFCSGLRRVSRKGHFAIGNNFGLPYPIPNLMFDKYLEFVNSFEIEKKTTVVMYTLD